MSPHVFDRSGIAALDDLVTPEGRELFLTMEREQAIFLAHEATFRSPAYKWPRDPLHTWSRCWEYPYVYRALSERFRPSQGAERPLLADVGSGVTFFPFAIAKLGCRVACTDLDLICEQDLAKAKRLVSYDPGEVSFRPCTLKRLPFEDEECDGVYCVSVIEHIADPGPTVEEIFRILKPGGLFCLTIDLDLRGNLDIGPKGYTNLHKALRSRFELAAPEKTIHPRNMLTSNAGPYPLGLNAQPAQRALWLRLLTQTSDVLDHFLGRKIETDFQLLAVEGSLWRKPSSTSTRST
jgi:SAM-dependent methyltransferase